MFFLFVTCAMPILVDSITNRHYSRGKISTDYLSLDRSSESNRSFNSVSKLVFNFTMINKSSNGLSDNHFFERSFSNFFSFGILNDYPRILSAYLTIEGNRVINTVTKDRKEIHIMSHIFVELKQKITNIAGLDDFQTAIMILFNNTNFCANFFNELSFGSGQINATRVDFKNLSLATIPILKSLSSDSTKMRKLSLADSEPRLIQLQGLLMSVVFNGTQPSIFDKHMVATRVGNELMNLSLKSLDVKMNLIHIGVTKETIILFKDGINEVMEFCLDTILLEESEKKHNNELIKSMIISAFNLKSDQVSERIHEYSTSPLNIYNVLLSRQFKFAQPKSLPLSQLISSRVPSSSPHIVDTYSNEIPTQAPTKATSIFIKGLFMTIVIGGRHPFWSNHILFAERSTLSFLNNIFTLSYNSEISPLSIQLQDLKFTELENDSILEFTLDVLVGTKDGKYLGSTADSIRKEIVRSINAKDESLVLLLDRYKKSPLPIIDVTASAYSSYFLFSSIKHNDLSSIAQTDELYPVLTGTERLVIPCTTQSLGPNFNISSMTNMQVNHSSIPLPRTISSILPSSSPSDFKFFTPITSHCNEPNQTPSHKQNYEERNKQISQKLSTPTQSPSSPQSEPSNMLEKLISSMPSVSFPFPAFPLRTNESLAPSKIQNSGPNSQPSYVPSFTPTHETSLTPTPLPSPLHTFTPSTLPYIQPNHMPSALPSISKYVDLTSTLSNVPSQKVDVSSSFSPSMKPIINLQAFVRTANDSAGNVNYNTVLSISIIAFVQIAVTILFLW